MGAVLTFFHLVNVLIAFYCWISGSNISVNDSRDLPIFSMGKFPDPAADPVLTARMAAGL